MSYQKVTGALSPGGHPGSYNGQDAYNDMLITDESILYRKRSSRPTEPVGKGRCAELYARPTGNFNRGGGTSMSEPVMMSDRKGHNGITEDGTSTTLNAQEKERPIVGETAVRRLTPLECERLQGFPDGWTDIGEWVDSKGKKHKEADSPRYKALGNSICTPFWFWLLRRISAQYERPATLGSLFDGIGGFPYCWERCNGPGTAVWASEIEEFPIAVTKKHFPEEASK